MRFPFHAKLQGMVLSIRELPHDTRKAIRYFLYFMGTMLVLTLLSNAANSATVAKVTATTPRTATIADTIKSSGTIIAKSKFTVAVTNGLKVENVTIGIGSAVESGDEILSFSLDILNRQLKESTAALAGQQAELAVLGISELGTDAVDALRSKSSLEAYEADLRYEKEQQQRDIEKAERDFREANREYRLARSEFDSAGDYDDVVGALTQLDKAETKVENAKKEFNGKQQLYDKLLTDGASETAIAKAREEMNNAETALADADKKYKDALDNYDDAIAGGSDSGESDTGRAYDALRSARDALYRTRTAVETAKSNNRIEDIERKITDWELQNQVSEIGKQNRLQKERGSTLQDQAKQQALAIKIEELEKEVASLTALIAADGKLSAPATGVLTKLELDKDSKLIGDAAIQIATIDGGFEVTAKVPGEIVSDLVLPIEATAEIGGKEIPCTVLSIGTYPDDNKKVDVKLQLPEGDYQDGKSTEILLTKSELDYSVCLPLGAIHSDSRGDFVYLLDKTKTIMGIQTTIRHVPVEIEMKDDADAAVKGAIKSDSLILLSSNKLVGEGDRVRLIEK